MQRTPSKSDDLCNVSFFTARTYKPNPKLEDHPLSSIRGCLFSISAAALHIWRPSAPSATWWPVMSWWRGTHLRWCILYSKYYLSFHRGLLTTVVMEGADSSELYNITRRYIIEDNLLWNCFDSFWFLEAARDSFLHSFRTGSGAHSALYSLVVRSSFLGGETAGKWSWLRASEWRSYTSTSHMLSLHGAK